MGNAQARLNNDSTAFILKTMDPIRNDDAIIIQDAGRSAVLEQFTLMAKIAASGKWTPLLAVDPTLTGANMVCGAIGGSLVDFAALSDGEFAISIDGVAMDIEDLDFTGLDTAQDVPGSLQCGANGANLAAWQAVADGAFNVTVNGLVINITGCAFTSIVDLSDVAAVINEVALGRFTVLYDHTADTFAIVSNTTGETSTVTVLSAPGAGTDISGAGFLDGQTGAGGGVPTAGTGGEDLNEGIAEIINGAALGRFFCSFNGDAFVFTSQERGTDSVVTVLSAVSGGAGTDISGASYLNGLTGIGTATAGTGGTGVDVPQGIYMGDDILAATLVAADVIDLPILLRGAMFDEDKLVLESSLDLDDVVGAGDPGSKTIRDILIDRNLVPTTTSAINAAENA